MANLPAGAVRTIGEALAAPEVNHREMVQSILEADGEIRVLGSSFKFAETELSPFRPPPLLGQDTDDILESVLSLSGQDISALRADDVVR